MDEARPCPVAAAFVDSHGALTDDAYRFSDHPDYVAAFQRSIDMVEALPCDLLITPHPVASDLLARFNGDAPLIDAGACRRFAESARSDLIGRLAGEVEAGTP
jgi:metallo-beta-lactamase class B